MCCHVEVGVGMLSCGGVVCCCLVWQVVHPIILVLFCSSIISLACLDLFVREWDGTLILVASVLGFLLRVLLLSLQGLIWLLQCYLTPPIRTTLCVICEAGEVLFVRLGRRFYLRLGMRCDNCEAGEETCRLRLGRRCFV